MEQKEKDDIKYRVALFFKNEIDKNKKESLSLKDQGLNSSGLITSYRKLEIASGVPIASISEIISGDRNPSVTTLVTLITSLNISMASFGKAYDLISDKEVEDYRIELKKKNKKNKDARSTKK